MRTDYDAGRHHLRPPRPSGWTASRRRSQVVQGLLRTDGPFSFDGELLRGPRAHAPPRPVQQPGPPLIIGGGGKRVLSFAARHADIVSINVNLREGTGGAETAADATPERTRAEGGLGEGGGRGPVRRARAQLADRVRHDHRRRGRPRRGHGARTSGSTPPTPSTSPWPCVGTLDEMAEELEWRRAGVRDLVLVDRVRRLGDRSAPVVSKLAGHVTITTQHGWEAHRHAPRAVRRAGLHPRRAVDRDRAACTAPRAARIPDLVVRLRRRAGRTATGRRVLLLDMLGYGLSAKPDRHYTMALQADLAAAFVAELGLDHAGPAHPRHGRHRRRRASGEAGRGILAGRGRASRGDEREHLH